MKNNQPNIIFNDKDGNNYYKCNDNSFNYSLKIVLNIKANHKSRALNKLETIKVNILFTLYTLV